MFDRSQHPNKRARPDEAPPPAPSASSSTDGRGYTVAVGKGVRHQLNGYLRPNNNGDANASHSIINITPTASSSSIHAPSATAATTAPSGSSSNATWRTSTAAPAAPDGRNHRYFAHPPSNQASSAAPAAAPAPLRFLDPSELGMSIESSLSQLKDNFALAANANSSGAGPISNGSGGVCTDNAASATPLSSNSVPTSFLPGADGGVNTSQRQSSSICNGGGGGGGGILKYAQSALTRRVTSATFLGGMLSRDDSLINLAMLPTLDCGDGGGEGSNGAFATAPSNYAGGSDLGIFSREDSLLNLAAAVEAVTSSASDGNRARNEDGAGEDDAFGFIDFGSS